MKLNYNIPMNSSPEFKKSYAYHIGQKVDLSGKTELTPWHIRNGLPFDPEDYPENVDKYRICFVYGDLDKVAKFCVGFSLFDDYHKFETSTEGIDYIRSNRIIVAVDRSKCTKDYPGQNHEIETIYYPTSNGGEFVDMCVTKEVIPVEGSFELPKPIRIPKTQLLREAKSAGLEYQKWLLEDPRRYAVVDKFDLDKFLEDYQIVRPMEVALRAMLTAFESSHS